MRPRIRRRSLMRCERHWASEANRPAFAHSLSIETAPLSFDLYSFGHIERMRASLCGCLRTHRLFILSPFDRTDTPFVFVARAACAWLHRTYPLRYTAFLGVHRLNQAPFETPVALAYQSVYRDRPASKPDGIPQKDRSRPISIPEEP